MAATNGSHILIGKKAIMSFLDCKEHQFNRLIEFGMPAAFVDRRWYASPDNIISWFNRFTSVQLKKIPGEEVE